MDTQPASAEPHTPAGSQATATQTHRDALNELIAMGMDLARLVHQHAKSQAEATPDAPPDPDLITAFERISRAVRRSIVLSRKLAEPVAPAADHAPERRAAARRRIIRAVEDTIQCFAEDTDAASLHAEFLDRLDGPDLDDDVDHRPVADIIADICRDLGLAALPGTHPWKRRTVEDIATLCARAAASQAPRIAPIITRAAPPRTTIRSHPPASAVTPATVRAPDAAPLREHRQARPEAPPGTG
jgi:hypothetical protein